MEDSSVEICFFKIQFDVDLSPIKRKILTKKLLSNGNPKIVQEDGRTAYFTLLGKTCGLVSQADAVILHSVKEIKCKRTDISFEAVRAGRVAVTTKCFSPLVDACQIIADISKSSLQPFLTITAQAHAYLNHNTNISGVVRGMLHKQSAEISSPTPAKVRRMNNFAPNLLANDNPYKKAYAASNGNRRSMTDSDEHLKPGFKNDKFINNDIFTSLSNADISFMTQAVSKSILPSSSITQSIIPSSSSKPMTPLSPPIANAVPSISLSTNPLGKNKTPLIHTNGINNISATSVSKNNVPSAHFSPARIPQKINDYFSPKIKVSNSPLLPLSSTRESVQQPIVTTPTSAANTQTKVPSALNNPNIESLLENIHTQISEINQNVQQNGVKATTNITVNMPADSSSNGEVVNNTLSVGHHVEVNSVQQTIQSPHQKQTINSRHTTVQQKVVATKTPSTPQSYTAVRAMNTTLFSNIEDIFQKELLTNIETPSSSAATATSLTQQQHSVNSIFSSSQVDSEEFAGVEVTSMEGLPEHVVQLMNVFDCDASEIRRHQSEVSREKATGEGSRETGGACAFLMGRVATLENELGSSQASPEENAEESGGDEDSDNAMEFSQNFLSRRRGKRNRRRRDEDCTSFIGADPGELLEDPSAVAYRNWGHTPNAPDSAETMFANTPEPVVKMNELDKLFDKISEFDKETETEPCDAILPRLLCHQKRALHWMIERENSRELPPFWECIELNRDYFNLATRRRVFDRPESVKGGILADDMGLGKTLAIISLILTNHLEGKPMFAPKKLPTEASDISIVDNIDSTNSIKIRHKKEGYVKPRTITKADFDKPGYKFRQMYLQQIQNKKKKKKNKKKEKKKEESWISLSDSDENDQKEQRNTSNHINAVINSPLMTNGVKRKFGQPANDSISTLIVCPMSVLSNWTDQLQQHIDPSARIQIYVYYGPDRVRDVNFLKQHHIIISTYGTVTADYRNIKLKQKKSPMHEMNWLRVVLDEGHFIRNARSGQHLAMLALNAQCRWILTGTPIQNRMTDLWSVVKFLRLEPFANRKWWFSYIIDSMKRRAKPGEAVFNRCQKLIKHIAIRRLKTDKINKEPIVKLPKRTVIVQKLQFNEDERKLYDAMQKDGKLIICKYFRMNTVLQNYANVLAIIMRLRQLCCHPKLCAKAVKRLQQAIDVMDQFQDQLVQQGDQAVEGDRLGANISDEEREKLIEQLMQLLASGDSEECSICLEYLQDPVITKCAHVFCSNCINEVVESSELAAACPLCRADIDMSTMVKVPQNNTEQEEEDDTKAKKKTNSVFEDGEEWHSSAKVDFLMEALCTLRNKDARIKSLVVSQFTTFLDVISKPLHDNGFHFVRLDGTMSQARRAQVISEFNSRADDSPTIMLLSLTAGGVGLNLTAATRVFLLDPAWNPAIEEQCFDRAHRLGQQHDVIIIKLIVENTVEDRMLILQQQKRELMKKAFGTAPLVTPEQRRATALRDIATLLGLNFNLNQNNPANNAVPLGRRNDGNPNTQQPAQRRQVVDITNDVADNDELPAVL